MKELELLPPTVPASAERRAIALLGAAIGLLVGFGILGILGLGVIVYFAAWCADLLDRFGEPSRKGGMILGFVLGFGLWVTFWSVAGATVGRFLTNLGKSLGKANHAA